MEDKDIRQLVRYAQGSPEYMPFYKACFCVAGLLSLTPEHVISVARATDELPEIAEAMRVPRYATFTQPTHGKDILF